MPKPPLRILVQFAHPALHRSRVNRELLEAIRGLEGVTVNDLYEEYPDSFVNADREQKLLREHDAIVFQHPLYWYSSPAILKEWQDIVLEDGFAYGEGGTALKGKSWLSAITTGGPADAYQPDGFNRFGIRQLLLPFEQTAAFCGMIFLDPFLVQGTFELSDQQISDAAARYRQIVTQLRDGAYVISSTDAQ